MVVDGAISTAKKDLNMKEGATDSSYSNDPCVEMRNRVYSYNNGANIYNQLSEKTLATKIIGNQNKSLLDMINDHIEVLNQLSPSCSNRNLSSLPSPLSLNSLPTTIPNIHFTT